MNKCAARLLCLLFIPIFAFGQTPRRNVLVIESYSSDYLWDLSCREGMEAAIGNAHNLRYFEMDTKRLPKTEHQKMADFAWNEYLSVKPDLVVLMDDAALKYLGDRFAPEPIPVVFVGINDNPRMYFRNQTIPANMGGVLERPILKRSFEYFKAVVPSAKRALILFDDDLTAAAVKKEMFSDKDAFELFGIKIDLEMINNFDLWKETVIQAQNRYDFLVLGLYHTVRNADGGYEDPLEIAEWTGSNSSVPVFGFWDFSVGKNASAGGFVLSGRSMGRQAGLIINNLLAGNAAQSVFMNEGEFIFSESRLNQWRLVLPESIRNKSTFVE